MDVREKSKYFEDYLAGKYADAKCSLDYSTPFQLICATALSAQCTDKRVNVVTKELFKRYPDAFALASADYETLCEIVKSAGMYRVKARNLINMAKSLVENFGGEVPDNIKDLTSLAGVGRKTANVILGNIFGQPGVVVDTHVKRIAHRLGLTDNEEPEKVEKDLEKLIDGKNHCMWGHRVISFGREICTAQRPKCGECGMKNLCRFYGSESPAAL